MRLWELRDEILAGKTEFLPFVPFLLDISPKPDVALLRKQRELINLEKNPKRRAELSGFSALLARRYFARKLITEVFRQEEQTMELIWEDMPFVGEKIKEKFTQGQILAIQKNILEVLNTRFGAVNGKIARLVNSMSESITNS